MPQYDPRVDAYLAQAAPFAQPILEYLRRLVHETCPEVEETIKWGMPYFEYKGPVCGLAAFKKHCSFGFWKGSLLPDPKNLLQHAPNAGMGHLGKIFALEDLPPEPHLKNLLLAAVQLNEASGNLVHQVPKKKMLRAELPEPEELVALLQQHPSAQLVWTNFAPSHRREYLEWILEAKTAGTREKRLLKTIEQLKGGQSRHAKYQAKKT
ncbi:MAG: DUF1801 domain-containing protein [Bacteroidetes bacterium]|nr:DUF1801 domain-containing protein [Bacteroidota bacterium]